MKSINKIKKDKAGIFYILVLIAAIVALLPLQISAAVTGECSNCHTMHNSQNGSAVNSGGPGINLLKNTSGLSTDVCVACHSASDGTTWQDGTTDAPIVWNQSEPTFNAQKGLAGGNFYWVAAGDDAKGHNVYGIASPDGNLSTAPGENTAGCGGNACHVTLAAAPSNENFFQGGCRGCHVVTYHHSDNGVYRFLKGHGVGPYPPVGQALPAARKDIAAYSDYVVGDEDDDWEHDTSGHNWYKGTTASYSGSGTALRDNQSITSFCAGCHRQFHGPYEAINGSGMGSSSPWVRHPTDIALPQSDGSEYAAYDLTDVGTYANYSMEAPVAWTNPTNPPDRGTPIVMCLSCHRPHGSENPDMLRWDYETMIASGGTNTTGCFTCHTTKDDGS